MKRGSYVTLVTESLDRRKNARLLSIGYFSPAQLEEFKRFNKQSTVWREIVKQMANLPNDRLTSIEARGGLNATWEADYVAPSPRKAAIVGYGPCAGIRTQEAFL